MCRNVFSSASWGSTLTCVQLLSVPSLHAEWSFDSISHDFFRRFRSLSEDLSRFLCFAKSHLIKAYVVFVFAWPFFLWVNLVLSSHCTRDLWWISFLFFFFLGSSFVPYLYHVEWHKHVRDEYKSLDIKCSSWNPNQWTWISFVCFCLLISFLGAIFALNVCFCFFSFSAELRSPGPMQTSGRYNLKCPRLYNLNCVRLLTLRGHSKSKWRRLL